MQTNKKKVIKCWALNDAQFSFHQIDHGNLKNWDNVIFMREAPLDISRTSEVYTT